MPSDCLPTEFCLMLNEPEAEIVGSVPVVKLAWFCNYVFHFVSVVQSKNSLHVALDLEMRCLSMILSMQSEN